MSLETTTIPQIRQVYYCAYGNIPTASMKVGDLAYATDRLAFYRWSGTALEPVTIHSSSGLASAIPTAGDLPEGSIYFETDTELLKQVQSGAWVLISKVLYITNGSYTGNEAVNRAVAHGLGVTPKVVIIHDTSAYLFTIINGRAYIHYQRGQSDISGSHAVTAMDATNFYVGNATNTSESANNGSVTYYWVAIG